MKKRRMRAAGALARGVLLSAAATLAGMLLLAGAVVLIGLSDTAIGVTNQALKLLSVAAGTFLGVGRGGERGLVTGAAVGCVYAAAGYCLYLLLGGGAFAVSEFLGEMLLCAAAGAVCGAVCANLPARRRAKA